MVERAMDLLQKTKELCRIYGIKPARSKGQNFLINEDIYKRIIEAANIKKDDIVLEVGPGLGFLTALLSEKAKKVIAVELDDKLAHYLKNVVKMKKIDNIEVVNGNILDAVITSHAVPAGRQELQITNQFENLKLKIKNFKVVANLPYNITSVFLRKFLSQENKPREIVLMLQKEVAERIAARPGDMSLLAVSVQFYATPEIIQIAPADNFWPQPDVDSAIIKLKVKSPSPRLLGAHPLIRGGDRGEVELKNEKNFFRLVKIGFSAKRKMLKNNLANGYHIGQDMVAERLKKAGFSQKVRAQELSVKDWILLLSYFE